MASSSSEAATPDRPRFQLVDHLDSLRTSERPEIAFVVGTCKQHKVKIHVVISFYQGKRLENYLCIHEEHNGDVQMQHIDWEESLAEAGIITRPKFTNLLDRWQARNPPSGTKRKVGDHSESSGHTQEEINRRFLQNQDAMHNRIAAVEQRFVGESSSVEPASSSLFGSMSRYPIYFAFGYMVYEGFQQGDTAGVANTLGLLLSQLHNHLGGASYEQIMARIVLWRPHLINLGQARDTILHRRTPGSATLSGTSNRPDAVSTPISSLTISRRRGAASAPPSETSNRPVVASTPGSARTNLRPTPRLPSAITSSGAPHPPNLGSNMASRSTPQPPGAWLPNVGQGAPASSSRSAQGPGNSENTLSDLQNLNLAAAPVGTIASSVEQSQPPQVTSRAQAPASSPRRYTLPPMDMPEPPTYPQADPACERRE